MLLIILTKSDKIFSISQRAVFLRVIKKNGAALLCAAPLLEIAMLGVEIMGAKFRPRNSPPQGLFTS